MGPPGRSCRGLGKDALEKREQWRRARGWRFNTEYKARIVLGEEVGSQVPSTSLCLEAPWIQIPAFPGCLPCPGAGMCPQCPSASAPGPRDSSWSSGLRLHWCLPSCARISAHPLGWESQHGDPTVPTQSWSCWEDAAGAGVSPRPAGTSSAPGFFTSSSGRRECPAGNDRGHPGMGGRCPTAASGKACGAQGGHSKVGESR